MPTSRKKGESLDDYTKRCSQYAREYREKNREKIRQYKKEYNKKWRQINGYHNEIKWKKNNLLKKNIAQNFATAVRAKKFQKMPCKICGDINVIAHHPDYEKPFEVIWLCKIHHYQIHQEIKSRNLILKSPKSGRKRIKI